ncbi:MAG: bifunctional pyr operon transcriptional regulator/uracil phosphoribosyltransferase PyrR [Elusimicrobia bacterium]|nr:bifunctional pyr operon transcriptional regulator/uracil phosphoribosyltransferase PyrR [Elusimicrobiota bacterium]
MKNFTEKRVLMNKDEIKHTLRRLANEIVEKNHGVENLAIIGIQTRGVHIAKRIIAEIQKENAEGDIIFGILDTTLYRDDFETLETPPPLKETEISFNVNDKKIILIDDVLFTGRSIRAAIDQLIDFGRPKNIQLAVLIDRGHRELPIEPNFVGKKIPTAREELVSVELEEVDGQDRVVLKQAK